MSRVTFVVDAPFLGGAELYISRLALGLDRKRFQPSVLMAESSDAGLHAWAEALVAAGIRVTRVPMRLPHRVGDALAIVRSLEALSPDIVHVNMPGPYSGQNALLVPIARACGARVVTTEHLPMVEPLWKRSLLKRAAYAFLDVAVTMTRVNAAWLSRAQHVPRAKVRVVANGVPFAYGTGARVVRPVPHVTFVGNLLPHKGPLRVIEALARVQQPWHLSIVGTGPEEAACRARVAALGITERVTFHGALAPAAVERHLLACDVLTLPSEIEGLPYTILEAMACALPVVAGNAYGVPEAVVDEVTGLLVAATDIDALAHALDRLLADAGLRERMGGAGRARFESQFTLERQVAAMESLYSELAGARG